MPTDTRTLLDPDVLAMLRGSLRQVLTEDSPASLADRLAELGWSEVVAVDAPTALNALFEIKGDALSHADALGPTLAAEYATMTGAEAPATLVLGAPNQVQLLDHTGSVTTIDVDATTWQQLEAVGRWLVASELVGIGQHVVAAAVEYTKERVQYGKPIGVFQALQHRLASAHALVTGAGRLAVEAGFDRDPWTAMVAKCMAGQAAEFACTQAQQCFGAIGFTWEHELPGYLRRTYELDRMFGDWRSLEHEIGARLQQTRVVPRIGTL